MKTNEYHVVWMIGINEHGTEMSTGKTYIAVTMEEALIAFKIDNPDVGEPVYILNKEMF